MENNVKGQPVCVHFRETKPLVTETHIFTSADECSLTEKELEKACNELGKTEERKAMCLSELKEKLLNDENVSYRTDDGYLLRFLRYRKYDSDKAYQAMKNLYQLRRKRPDIFKIPENLRYLQDLNCCTRLPYRDEEGRIMFCVNVDRWIPQENSFEELFQAMNALADIVTFNPKVQINGIIGIWDMSGIKMIHLTEVLKKNRIPAMLSVGLNCYPWRLKMLIGINVNRIGRIFINIMLPLLSRKMAKRVVVLGSNYEELHQYVNPAILPRKFGGELDEESCCMGQHLIENLPYIRYERSFGFETENCA